MPFDRIPRFHSDLLHRGPAAGQIPCITADMSTYACFARAGGVQNRWTPYKLSHDINDIATPSFALSVIGLSRCTLKTEQSVGRA